MNHGCVTVTQRQSRKLNPTKTFFAHSVTDRVDLLGDRRRALELQMKIKRLLLREGLPAMWALDAAVHLDPNILETSIARLGAGADLHRLRHLPTSRCQRSSLRGADARELDTARDQ